MVASQISHSSDSEKGKLVAGLNDQINEKIWNSECVATSRAMDLAAVTEAWRRRKQGRKGERATYKAASCDTCRFGTSRCFRLTYGFHCSAPARSSRLDLRRRCRHQSGSGASRRFRIDAR